jgi:hypothetical protein
MEGGNLPGVNSVVPREHLESTVVNGLILANLKGLPYAVVGNKNKPYLGDVDIAVESQNVAKKIGFKGSGAEDFWKKLDDHLKKSKIEYHKIVKGLTQFHIVIPLVDKRRTHLNAVEKDGKDPDVKRKLQVNWKQGIEVVDFTYDEKGKRQKLKVKKVTGDMDKFTKFLFGAQVNFRNIDSFEKLYKLFMSKKFHFPKLRKNIVTTYKKTLNNYKLNIPKELK